MSMYSLLKAFMNVSMSLTTELVSNTAIFSPKTVTHSAIPIE